jgi:hypothetical protein
MQGDRQKETIAALVARFAKPALLALADRAYRFEGCGVQVV